MRAHLIDVLSITTRALEGVLPKSGPLAMRHFHLSLSALVINYFTYGPVLGKTWWGKDPLGARGLSERRDHVHWVIDAWLGALGLPVTAATSTGTLRDQDTQGPGRRRGPGARIRASIP
ncbi:MAG: hypothetical protein H6720_11420 [Sandaracinus sp.]|nr:hypothetical protein [Sandaracinus sp.]